MMWAWFAFGFWAGGVFLGLLCGFPEKLEDLSIERLFLVVLFWPVKTLIGELIE